MGVQKVSKKRPQISQPGAHGLGAIPTRSASVHSYRARTTPGLNFWAASRQSHMPGRLQDALAALTIAATAPATESERERFIVHTPNRGPDRGKRWNEPVGFHRPPTPRIRPEGLECDLRRTPTVDGPSTARCMRAGRARLSRHRGAAGACRPGGRGDDQRGPCRRRPGTWRRRWPSGEARRHSSGAPSDVLPDGAAADPPDRGWCLGARAAAPTSNSRALHASFEAPAPSFLTVGRVGHPRCCAS